MAHLNEQGELVPCGPTTVTPLDYARHLTRMMERGATVEEISIRTGRSVVWVDEHLALLKETK